jgi:hypothetical protein
MAGYYVSTGGSMGAAEKQIEKAVHIGLGEAISRFVKVKNMISMGVYPDDSLAAEVQLIEEALNQQYQLNLGFDCNMDDVPDTVAIFAASAETSCCRILPIDERPKKARGSSRASTTTKKK